MTLDYYVPRLALFIGLLALALALYPQLCAGVRIALACMPRPRRRPNPLARAAKDGRLVTVGDCFALPDAHGNPRPGTEREVTGVDFDLFKLEPILGVSCLVLEPICLNATDILGNFVPVIVPSTVAELEAPASLRPAEVSQVIARVAAEPVRDTIECPAPENMERTSETLIWHPERRAAGR